MAQIEIYRQQRADGGIRTGLEVGGEQLLQSFEPGKGEPDPAIEWYVDIRCKARGKGPRTSAEAMAWLSAHSELLRTALERAADRVPVGTDPSVWPRMEGVHDAGGMSIVVAYSAISRAKGRQIAAKMRSWARTFSRVVDKLAA